MLQDINIEQCKTLGHLFDLKKLSADDEDEQGKYFSCMKRLILT